MSNKDELDLKMFNKMKDNINQLLDENKELKLELDELKKKHKIISARYTALRKSKLGKITLKYWKLKNRKNKNSIIDI